MNSSAVSGLLHALDVAIDSASSSKVEKDTHTAIFGHLPFIDVDSVDASPQAAAACSNLERCYTSLDLVTDENVGSVARAFRGVESLLTWHSYEPTEVSPGLDTGYADALLAGPDGALINTDRIRIGVSVMAPHTLYPDHRHPAPELYLALSAGQWRQEDNEWHEPGIGGVFYNYPNVVHSMRTLDEPMLSIWCLPLRE